MKHILICCIFILNTVVAQDTTKANELIDAVYTQLIKYEGSMINFEYVFENEAHKMQKPISGKLGLFSNNRCSSTTASARSHHLPVLGNLYLMASLYIQPHY